MRFINKNKFPHKSITAAVALSLLLKSSSVQAADNYYLEAIKNQSASVLSSINGFGHSVISFVGCNILDLCEVPPPVYVTVKDPVAPKEKLKSLTGTTTILTATSTGVVKTTVPKTSCTYITQIIDNSSYRPAPGITSEEVDRRISLAISNIQTTSGPQIIYQTRSGSTDGVARLISETSASLSNRLDIIERNPFTPAATRSFFSTSGLGLDYSTTTGVISLSSGYNIPLTASTTNWNSFYNTPSTRITAGNGLSWSGNTLSASGNGSALTNLNASNISSGSLALNRLVGYPSDSNVFLRGDGTWASVSAGGFDQCLNTGSDVTFSSVTGNGAGLTNLAISNIAGYPNDNTLYLRGDGTWATVSGGGSVDLNALTSIEVGFDNLTECASASAVGYCNVACGLLSSAVGSSNSSVGNCASTAGYSNEVNGFLSSAIGTDNVACGQMVSAFGSSNYSCACCLASSFGTYNCATGNMSSAFGYGNTASGDLSSVFGSNIVNSTSCSVEVGADNCNKLQISSTGVNFVSENGCGFYVNGSLVGGNIFNQTLNSNDDVAFDDLCATTLSGSGSGITNLNASNISSGSICGSYISGYPNDVNQVLRGDGSWGSVSGGSGDLNSLSCIRVGVCNIAGYCTSSAFGYCNAACGDYSSAFGSCVSNSNSNSVEIGADNANKLQISSAGVNFVSQNGCGFYVNGSPVGGGCGSYNQSLNSSDSVTFNLVCASNFCGDGSGISNLSFSNISSGSLSPSYISGYPGSDSVFLRGDGTWASVVSGGFDQLLNTSNCVGFQSVCACCFYGDGSGITNLTVSNIAAFPNDISQVLKGDGTWGTVSVDLNNLSCINIGCSNSACGSYSSAMGASNIVSGDQSSAFGYGNTASGCQSSAFGSCIYNSTACSAELGYDDSNKIQINSSGLNLVSSGVISQNGGAPSFASDRNLKENFVTVDPQDILGKINRLNIPQWNYKAQNANMTHIAPIAQEFYEVFNLNNSDKSISAIDPAGIALVGIQALTANQASTTLALNDLKIRFDALTSVNATSTSGGLLSSLQSFGASIVDGIVHFKDVVLEKLGVSNLTIKNSADVGKTGYVIYDRATGQPICVYFENGVQKTSPGDCEDVSVPNSSAPTSTPSPTTPDTVTGDASTSTSTPPSDTAPTDTSVAPEPSPEPTPTPEPETPVVSPEPPAPEATPAQ